MVFRMKASVLTVNFQIQLKTDYIRFHDWGMNCNWSEVVNFYDETQEVWWYTVNSFDVASAKEMEVKELIAIFLAIAFLPTVRKVGSTELSLTEIEKPGKREWD